MAISSDNCYKEDDCSFKLPRDWQIYVQGIVERCENLIFYGIWNGIHITRFRSWIANFHTDEEKYFAACILDFLIYRSEDQTVALIKQLFQRTLPDLCRLDPIPPCDLSNWEKDLRLRPPFEHGIRLVAVLKKTDPVTKSAPAIARLMKRHLKINEFWIIQSGDMQALLKEGVKCFVFIDDFLGTGDQFIKFINKDKIAPLIESTYTIYAPLVAHAKGIERLRMEYPNLRVECVETLDSSHSLFHEECPCFNDDVNSPNGAKDFYNALLKKRGIKIAEREKFGYGHLELAFSFSHASPNNSLPILWLDRTPNWRPLFDR